MAKAKTEVKDDVDDKTKDDVDDDKGGGDRTVRVDPEQLRDVVKSVVAEMAPALGGKVKDDVDDDDDVDDKPKGRRSQRDEEDSMHRLVRDEVAKLREAEDHDNRLKAVEDKLVEKPPAAVRRLTKAMWG